MKAGLKAVRNTKVWITRVLCIAALTMMPAKTLLGQKQAASLPKNVGESMVIDVPDLPADARKLEFVLVPGLGKLQPFLLGKYEVTQAQYESVMHTNPSTFRKGPNYPVEQTSWLDAKDFCAKLTS